MSNFSMFRGFVFFGLVLGMFSGVGEVRAELRVPIPLALQDMNATTKLDFDLGLIPADTGFGLASRVGFLYGNGTFAGGVFLPFVLLVPDNGGNTFVLGNPTVNFTLAGRVRTHPRHRGPRNGIGPGLRTVPGRSPV
jgi:hypothetical protein